MTEFQILSAIRNKGGSILYTELLSLNLTDSKPDPMADKHRLQNLISDGYISGNLNAYGTIRMEPKGTARLDQMKQELDELNKARADEASKDRKQKGFDFITALVGAIVGGILAVLVELLG